VGLEVNTKIVSNMGYHYLKIQFYQFMEDLMITIRLAEIKLTK